MNVRSSSLGPRLAGSSRPRCTTWMPACPKPSPAGVSSTTIQDDGTPRGVAVHRTSTRPLVRLRKASGGKSAGVGRGCTVQRMAGRTSTGVGGEGAVCDESEIEKAIKIGAIMCRSNLASRLWRGKTGSQSSEIGAVVKLYCTCKWSEKCNGVQFRWAALESEKNSPTSPSESKFSSCCSKRRIIRAFAVGGRLIDAAGHQDVERATEVFER